MRMNVRKSLKFIALLISALMIGTASAIAYVVLEWKASMTVQEHPKVCFIEWDTGDMANTFTYSVNIFPGVVTIDENITYGILNWDSVKHNVRFRLASTNTNETDVDWIRYKVYNASTTIHMKDYTDLDNPDTSWSDPIELQSGTKYSIYIAVKAGLNAKDGHTPQFTFEMMVENP